MPGDAKSADYTGRTLGGRIVLEGLVGAGSMGAVYRGQHRLLNKLVAVKVMHPSGDDYALRSERFVREAQTAAHLDHPNAVRILDFGEEETDGLLYIVMEYLEGYDLGQLLVASGALPEVKSCEIMLQVLAALAAAHDMGVVHRDVKPPNIMLLRRANDDGQLVDVVKVCDFGLAKALDFRAHVTHEGRPGRTAVGTPLYMSPEQAVGDALDGRSDVYSSGVVLYEMLTGCVPFDGDNAFRVMMRHVSEEPPPPSRIVPSIDPRLERIVLWTLAKRPEERCPSARELRRVLADFIAERAAAPSTLPPLPRPPAPVQQPTLEWLIADLADAPATAPPQPAKSDSLEALPLEAIIGDAPPPADPVDLERAVLEAVQEVVDHRESTTSGDVDTDSLSVDFRRHAGAVSDCAQYMWKHYGVVYTPYAGPYPFWVRDHNKETIGPLDYRDVATIIRQEGLRGHKDSVALSSDGRSWIPTPMFVKLTGQETLLASELSTVRDVFHGSLSGNLAGASLTAVFGKFARERPTGRLYFRHDTQTSIEQIEVHLVSGMPTFVSTTEPGLELPQLIVEKNIIARDMLPKILHNVVQEERPLEEIVLRLSGVDLVPYRPTFMKARLLHLFRWKNRGQFGFDAAALPASMTSFASSLLGVLPELVYHAFSAEGLHSSLWPYLDRPCERSERFMGALRQMQLAPPIQKIAMKFGEGRRLDESLECRPAERRNHLAIAYVLLETGLIIPRGGLQRVT